MFKDYFNKNLSIIKYINVKEPFWLRLSAISFRPHHLISQWNALKFCFRIILILVTLVEILEFLHLYVERNNGKNKNRKTLFGEKDKWFVNNGSGGKHLFVLVKTQRSILKICEELGGGPRFLCSIQ